MAHNTVVKLDHKHCGSLSTMQKDTNKTLEDHQVLDKARRRSCSPLFNRKQQPVQDPARLNAQSTVVWTLTCPNSVPASAVPVTHRSVVRGKLAVQRRVINDGDHGLHNPDNEQVVGVREKPAARTVADSYADFPTRDSARGQRRGPWPLCCDAREQHEQSQPVRKAALAAAAGASRQVWRLDIGKQQGPAKAAAALAVKP